MKNIILLSALLSPAVFAQTADPRPNIVFILTDDLDLKSIRDNMGRTIDGTVFMPRLKAMADQGLTFTNAYATYSLCCPSRASILRGQYAHNTGVMGNVPPLGGFEKFYALGHDSSTIGTWLRNAGYKTALIGKYLNQYPATAPPLYMPPGWDEWGVKLGGNLFYDYARIENGRRVQYGSAEADYLTDVETAQTVRFIQGLDNRPFFLYLAPFAPHQPSTPAPRHTTLFRSISAPRTPAFDEPDVSDKPAWIRALPPLSSQLISQIDGLYRQRLRSMMAVDDMIGRVIDELRAKGKLNNTYIFFTSDHGFHLGEHRQGPNKGTAYEEDILIPLIVVGPGVPSGQRSHPVLNIDFAPTFAALAGAAAPAFVDGRSFQSLLTSQPPALADWRTSFLVEYAEGAYVFPAPSYNALRIRGTQENILYNELAAGSAGGAENEFYDLTVDPFQLENRYASLPPARRNTYRRLLDDLRQCQGSACRAAENRRLPSISSVISATGVGDSVQSNVQKGSWAAVYGTGLADRTSDWTGRIVNGVLPTTLDGVSVTVNGTPAPVYFVSPEQVNFQIPETTTGPAQVVVTNNGTGSAPATARVENFAPAFFHWGTTKYAVATRYPDNALIAPPSLPGASYVAAKPRDVLILWGTGFGPTNPPVQPGVVTAGAPAPVTLTMPTVMVGGMPTTVMGAALSPGLVGVYQIAIQLPDSVTRGDVLVRASVAGFQTPGNVFLFVSPQ